ncbi:MAG: NADH:flavin oxidoreductase [Deltaproteobacteria bacterium]|nr:NADH:flavin oxidoreductase [Deltaproteobacteria bacterium]
MNELFGESHIHHMILSNRFVRSATWEGMAATDGAVTPKLCRTMAALATGGVGLIISSHAYVSPEGQAGPWQLGIYKDDLIAGLKEMTAAVHVAGGKIVAQLAHAGQAAAAAVSGRTPLVVSDFDGLMNSPRREMTAPDIQHIITAFADAAARARSSGFDGVQIHAAHGYLLNQFLSPAFNRRRDDYGGPLANRTRIIIDVLRAVRETVGSDFPILVKMNGQDFIENGLTLADSLQAAELLAAFGVDAIELSGGIVGSRKLMPSRTGINSVESEAYFREEARAFKKRIPVPLILVGGLRSLEVAEGLMEEGAADYISMCRPFIREPGLINRWKAGDRRKSTCLSDNQCFTPGREGKGIYCVVLEREQAKKKESRND